MRKLLLFLLLSTCALAQSALYYEFPIVKRGVNGTLVPVTSATVTVCQGEVSSPPCTLATVYTTSAMDVELDNPTTVSMKFSAWWLPGTYTAVITGYGFTTYYLPITLPAGEGTVVVNSLNGRSGLVTLEASDVTRALGYVPAQVVSLPQSQTCDYANGYAIVGYDAATNVFTCAIVGQATPPPSPTGDNYYVATTGSDTTGDGTQASPWRTIGHAHNTATAGSTIHVGDGTHTLNLELLAGGTAGSPLIIKCDNKWQCLLRPATSSLNYILKIGSGIEYVWIDGFDIAGATGTESGIVIYGPNNKIINNRIHDFSCTDTADYGNCVGAHVVWNGQTSSVRSGNEISNNVFFNIFNSDRTKKVGQCVYVGDSGTAVTNNVCYNVGGYGIQFNHYASANKAANNTIACNNTSVPEGLMLGVGGTNDGYTLSSTNNVFANNIITGCKNGVNVWASGGSNFVAPNYWMNNLTYGNTTNTSVGNLSTTFASKITQSGDLHSDPLYVSPTYNVSGNFNIQSSSPAKSAGNSTYAPTTNINGTTRAVPPNIGAY